METVLPQQTKRGANQAQDHQDELVERIARAVPVDGTVEPQKGVLLHRSSSPGEPLHSVYDPVFCVIAQGSKEVFLGHERYPYDAAHSLLVPAELPLVSHVLEASRERPYLSLGLLPDPTLVGSVMAEAGHAAPPKQADVRAINVSALDAGLLDAVVRLVR